MLTAVGAESEYRNDELIDNQLRSVLFQVPRSPNAGACLDGPPLPDCFAGVVDVGAIDVERGRDHGIPLSPTRAPLRPGIWSTARMRWPRACA
jgi:hypothetical protein